MLVEIMQTWYFFRVAWPLPLPLVVMKTWMWLLKSELNMPRGRAVCTPCLPAQYTRHKVGTLLLPRAIERAPLLDGQTRGLHPLA